MYMNVSGIVCQLILYFPDKQGLAILDELSKINNARALNFLTPLLLILISLAFGAITKYIINTIPLGYHEERQG